MHPNSAFRETPEEMALGFARERGFGVLALSGPDGPVLSHVPFLLSADGAEVELHLVRSNPIVTLLGQPQPAVIAVSGPDGYISPDWYGLPDQVPTWNYVAVHLRGHLSLAAADDLHPMLDRLSAAFEARLAPKSAWTSAKMSPGVMERMMRAILPCRMTVTRTDSTWKLNQNKPAEVRLRAADHVAATGVGSDLTLLAALMRGA